MSVNVTRKEIRGLIALAVVLTIILGVLWLTEGLRSKYAETQQAQAGMFSQSDTVLTAGGSAAVDTVQKLPKRRSKGAENGKSPVKKKTPAVNRRSPLENINN